MADYRAPSGGATIDGAVVVRERPRPAPDGVVAYDSQRLEILGQLAGGVAYHFNNLIAVILDYTSFIAAEDNGEFAIGAGEHWAEVQADLHRVRLAAERATELTEQLRSTSGPRHCGPGFGTDSTAPTPATAARPPRVGAPRAPAARQRAATVLIVETDDARREMTGRLLARHGHAVLTSASGSAAIELAQHYGGEIDLLLSAAEVPGLVESVRARRPGIRVMSMPAPGERPLSEAEMIANVGDVLDTPVKQFRR